MGYKQITKKQFDAAYNQSLPNGWIRFAYKYFSKETERKDMSLQNNLTFFLMGLFLMGFFGTAFKASQVFIGTATIIYSIVLAILVLYLLSAVLLNNRRLKKVMRVLNVTKPQYNYLVDKYYRQ